MEVKGNFINNGTYVDVHDNDVVNLSVDGNGEVHVDKAAKPDVAQQEIIDKLKPIFFGDEEEARKFLVSIQGMKPIQITEHVNRLVQEKKISELSKKRVLYQILHEAQLYPLTEQNWCSQVK